MNFGIALAGGPLLPPPPPAAVLIVPLSVLAAIFIALVVSSKLRRKLHRGPHSKKPNTGLTVIEETGVVDVAVLYLTVVFFIYGSYLASAISAFAFGIASIYFLDHITSFAHKRKLEYVKLSGVIRYIEELGILESGVIVAAIYMFLQGEYAAGIALSWVFGMFLAMMVDKARERRSALRRR
jgi:hypothetical protein